MRSSVLYFAILLLTLTGACGKKNNNNSSPGFGGSSILKPTANLSGASSLLVVDPSQKNGTSLVEMHNKVAEKIGAPKLDLADADAFYLGETLDLDATTSDGTSSLQKTDKKGNLASALTSTSIDLNSGSNNANNNNPPQPPPPLPKILTIAESPAPYNEIFLHFETAFRFIAPTGTSTATTGPGMGDQRLDGTFCQLFRVKGGSIADLQKTAPTADNLECLDADHFIDQWNASRLSVFQFDAKGNVYFPGSIPNSSKMVVYKWDRSTTKLTEMINSNICVQDFLVTKSGGMFYTGTSSCNGGGGNNGNGGFFRYITSGTGALTEIARNWSNFIYEPSTSAAGDQAIFFGPDPTSATTASWNSACLFKFDPAGGDTTAARTSSVITCGSNIWDWIQMQRTQDKATFGKGFQDGNDASAEWRTEFASRCTSEGQIFAGGGSQISSIHQDSKGQVYVIGNVRKKNKGTLECSVEIRGPHCKDSTGDPDISITTESACSTAGGTWVDDGFCQSATGATSSTCFTNSGTWNRRGVQYNGTSGDICTSTLNVPQADWWSSDNTKSFQNAANSAANVMKFRMNNMNCMPPANATSNGDQWTSEYQGLGKVNADTLTLSLLSGTDEQAINLWVINDVVYYSAFNATSGQYLLRNYDGTQTNTMVTNLETYHLSASGDTSSLYFDGLDFSNNTYAFGTILTAAPYTRTSKTGLTGTLKLVVILPKF